MPIRRATDPGSDAVDSAQLVKQSDVDFWGEGNDYPPNSVGGTMAGNDQIAFLQHGARVTIRD